MPLFWINQLVNLFHTEENYIIGMSDCDILALSLFWNNHNYAILTIFDEKLMQQVMYA